MGCAAPGSYSCLITEAGRSGVTREEGGSELRPGDQVRLEQMDREERDIPNQVRWTEGKDVCLFLLYQVLYLAGWQPLLVA